MAPVRPHSPCDETMPANMENRFFLWRGIDASPSRIVPQDFLPQLPLTDLRYFVRTLQNLDQLLPAAGQTFFLTWNLDRFHETMEDAVIILVGDEQHQTPSYPRPVKMIFKTGGYRRSSFRETLRLPASVAWRQLFRDSRNGAVQVKRRLQYGFRGHNVPPMYEIPAGPFALVDIDPLPIEQRPVDVSFWGETASGWTPNAKLVSRKHMAAAVAATQSAQPRCRLELRSGGSESSNLAGRDAYTQFLANAKIALTPRGNYDGESSRIFEAAKLACVIISEPLPTRWYFRECPAIQIPDWSALAEVLSGLLNDSARLKQLSQRTRQWWDTTISEAAIANFIVKSLETEKTPALPRG